MKKALSIILFILAALFVAGALGSTLLRSSAGVAPECGVVLVMLAIGAVCAWGGVKMWRR